MDIKFTAGKFLRFQAIRALSIGALAERSLVAGEVVEYDGLTLIVDGQHKAVPSFRAAIRAGWFNPLDEVEYLTTRTAPAPVRQTVVADDDERHVRAATANPKPVRPDATVRSVSDSPSEGEVVGRVSTKAQQRFVISNEADAARAMSAIREAESTSARRAPKLPVITEGADQNGVEVVSDVNARKKEAQAAALARAAARKADLEAPTPDPVAEVNVTGTVPAGSAGADIASSVLAAAQAVSPGFNWDLKAHWKSRVKTALDRRADPNFIAAVLMVESDTVRKAVVEGLKG